MRAALYARVSTEDQAEQFGLASQLRAMREHAAAKGWTVGPEFIEDKSGKDLDRERLDALRSGARNREYDAIIVHSPDRLTRNLGHLLLLMEEWKRAGVHVEFLTGGSEDSAEGRLLRNVQGVIAEYEREKIRERTSRGRREKARQGFVAGGRIAYGYAYRGKGDGSRGELLVNEAEARWVRKAFDWILDGCSTREVAVRLAQSGASPRVSAHWNRSSVARMLRNDLYIGHAHYNRYQRMGSELKQRAASEWIEVQVPAIIACDIFERVQRQLDANRALMVGRPSRTYLLRGLLHCGLCGKRYAGNATHGKRYYRCCGRDRTEAKTCRAGVIPAELIETAVWRAVTEPFQHPRTLRKIVQSRLSELQPRQPESNGNRLAAIDAEVDRLRRREERAIEELLDAAPEHAAAIRKRLTADRLRRERLESDAAGLRSASEAAATALQSCEAICREVRRRLGRLADDQRREFLRLLVSKITMSGKEAAIECKLPLAAANGPDQQHDVGISITLKTRVA